MKSEELFALRFSLLIFHLKRDWPREGRGGALYTIFTTINLYLELEFALGNKGLMHLDKEGSADHTLLTQVDIRIPYNLYLCLLRCYDLKGKVIEVLGGLIDNLVGIDIGNNIAFFLVGLTWKS